MKKTKTNIPTKKLLSYSFLKHPKKATRMMNLILGKQSIPCIQAMMKKNQRRKATGIQQPA
jgi:hypothetical protein